MEQEIVLTHEGLQELQDKLDNLKSVGRKEAAEKLKVARSFGDLSENSEYDEAKSDQAKLEAEIKELEVMIAHAKVVDIDNSTEVVHMNSVVTVKEAGRGGATRTFHITGYAQANPREGKISDESPMGKALMGHKVGDKIVVEAPKGELSYKITDITVENN